MTEEARWCVMMLREGACCSNCVDAYPSIDYPFPCEEKVRVCDNMNKAADLIESLCAELERVQREQDGLQAEINELNEEYFTDIHTARDPMADKVKQLERERDAAVKDMERMGEYRPYCETCLHVDSDSKEEPCRSCCEGYLISNWQWRGAKMDQEV